MRSQRRTPTLAGPVAGAALFAAGAFEGARLLRGGDPEARRSAQSTGTARVVAGGLLLARPRSLADMVGGDRSAARRTPWLPRMLGVREVVLGAATLTANRAGADVRPWLLALSLVDAAEMLVVLQAVRGGAVERSRGLAFAAADAGSAIAGAGVLAQLLHARRAPEGAGGTPG